MPKRCPAEGCSFLIKYDAGNTPTYYGCWYCWNRLPQPLRKRYGQAIRTFGVVESMAAVRVEIEAWWKENPRPASTPSMEPQVPLWRRHKQEEK